MAYNHGGVAIPLKVRHNAKEYTHRTSLSQTNIVTMDHGYRYSVAIIMTSSATHQSAWSPGSSVG